MSAYPGGTWICVSRLQLVCAADLRYEIPSGQTPEGELHETELVMSGVAKRGKATTQKISKDFGSMGVSIDGSRMLLALTTCGAQAASCGLSALEAASGGRPGFPGLFR